MRSTMQRGKVEASNSLSESVSSATADSSAESAACELSVSLWRSVAEGEDSEPLPQAETSSEDRTMRQEIRFTKVILVERGWFERVAQDKAVAS